MDRSEIERQVRLEQGLHYLSRLASDNAERIASVAQRQERIGAIVNQQTQALARLEHVPDWIARQEQSREVRHQERKRRSARHREIRATVSWIVSLVLITMALSGRLDPEQIKALTSLVK